MDKVAAASTVSILVFVILVFPLLFVLGAVFYVLAKGLGALV